MKKFLAVLISVSMLFIFAMTATASRIDVDYTDNSVKITHIKTDSNTGDSDSLLIGGFYAIDDLWSVNAAYTFADDSDFNTLILGGRYQLRENISLGANFLMYIDGDSNADDLIRVDAAANHPINENLTIAAKALVAKGLGNGDYDMFSLLAQAEYQINEMFVANAGFSFSDYSIGNYSDSITCLVVGAEAYPSEQISVGLDFEIDTEDSDNKNIVLQAAYNF